MADLCDICIKRLDHWEDPIPDYEGVSLCSQCNEEVDDLYESKEGKKSFEWCVKQITKEKLGNEKVINLLYNQLK